MTNATDNDLLTTMGFKLPAGLKMQFKIYCIQNGVSQTDKLNELIRAEISTGHAETP